MDGIACSFRGNTNIPIEPARKKRLRWNIHSAQFSSQCGGGATLATRGLDRDAGSGAELLWQK
jgi:hypothetical protein